MKSGFTLIELSIGLFLSALIGSALYNAFFVTNRVITIADTIVEDDLRMVLIDNQLEKDLDGVLVLDQTELTQTKTSKPAQEAQKEKAAQKETAPEGEQKPEKPIEKIFYSENGANDSLSVLTFITNNPVKVYEKATNVTPQTRLVRVVYRLVAQEEEQKSFKLIRQESRELDFKAYDPKAAKPIKGYELAQGIKSMKCDYIYPLQKEEEQKKVAAVSNEKAPQEEKPKPEYTSVKIWNVESKKDEKKEQPKIPQFITCTCELWSSQGKRERTTTFNFEIPTFAATLVAQKKEQKASKPPAATPPTPQPPAIPAQG